MDFFNKQASNGHREPKQKHPTAIRRGVFFVEMRVFYTRMLYLSNQKR